VSEVVLAAYKDDGETLAEMEDFRDPLWSSFVRLGTSCLLDATMLTFSWTLSSESGESIAKQIRMTWESGYDNGRRRS
jgi:hypothetical protein